MNLGIWEIVIIALICLPFILLAAVAVVLVSRRRDNQTANRVQCPYCAEWIMPEARVCRYCGRDLTAGENKTGA